MLDELITEPCFRRLQERDQAPGVEPGTEGDDRHRRLERQRGRQVQQAGQQPSSQVTALQNKTETKYKISKSSKNFVSFLVTVFSFVFLNGTSLPSLGS